MKCQATKTHWIKRGRENGASALILYINADECHEVMFRDNRIKDLEELGYTIIEEIFI